MAKVIRVMKLSFLLRLVLCIQLLWAPYYGYSADNDSDTSDTNTDRSNQEEDSLQDNIRAALKEFSLGADPFQGVLETTEAELREEDKKSPELGIGKKIDILNAIAAAMDTGTLKEYLNEFPELRKKAQNIFLFSDQTVETIKYHFDAQINEVVTEASEPLKLNDYASHPIPVVFTNIKVRYDQESKELLFEGTITQIVGGQEEERVVVRHRIPDMHIMDYANDGELLVLVDAKKGLLVVNMVFAESYLSKAPIPFTTVPTPVLQNLAEQSSLDAEKGKVTVELYKDEVRAPDTVPEYVDNLQKTFEGKTLITHGDLMVSYTDSNNQKHLVQFLKRAELAGWLKTDYSILDMMIKIVAPHIMSEEEIRLFAEKQQEMREQRQQIELQWTLASLFSRGSVQKLIQAKDNISYIIDNQLADMRDKENETYRQITTLEEIRENADVVLRQVEEQITSQNGEEYTPEDEEQNSKKMEVTARALRLIKAVYSNSSKALMSGLKEHKIELITGAIFGFPALYFALKSMLYQDGMVFYVATTLPHLLAVGAFLPVAIILSSRYYPDVIKKAHQKIPTNWTRRVIDKWGGTTWKHRMAGVAIKVVSYGMLGLWIWSAKAIGKPHVFEALHKGLNPREKITKDSDIGKMVGLKEDTTLGTKGWQWNKNSKDFVKQEHLLEVAQEKQLRIHFLSWLMAVLAASQKGGVSPIDALIYGVGRFDLEALAKIKTDSTLQMEILWVVEHLQKEIKKLDTLDIRAEISDIDPKVLNEYYEIAEKQVQRLRSAPHLQRKIRTMFHIAKRLIDQTPLKNFYPRALLTQNMEDSKNLQRVPNDLVASRVAQEFMVDHIVVILMPLVATDRATFHLEHFTNDLSMYSDKLFFTGGAHGQDVFQNVLAHLVISAGQRSMQFTDKPFIAREISKKYTDINKSAAPDLYPIQGRKHTLFEEFKVNLDYLKMTGEPDKKAGYPDNFVNLGETLWKESKTRAKTWQIGLSLMVSFRMLWGGQTLEEAFFAYLLFYLTGGSIMAFWNWLGRGQQMNDVLLNNNKKKMEQLQSKLYRVRQFLYESEETLKADYKAAVLEVVDLYSKNGLKTELLKVIEPVNPSLFSYVKSLQEKDQAEWSVPQNNEEIKLTVEQFLQLISKSPPLPTEVPNVARPVMSFIFGGLVTTYIGIVLTILSFNKNYLNWETIGMVASTVFSIYTIFYWVYSEKFKQWKQSKRNRGVRGEERLLSVLFRDWGTYFYEGVLGLGQGARNVCRRAFNRPLNNPAPAPARE